MHNPTILDHFQNPRNSGELSASAVRVEVTNPVCGDILELWVSARDGIVEQIRFKAKGCVASIACGSALTELVQGRTLSDAKRLNTGTVARALGGLPPGGGHASVLAIDALKAAIQAVEDARQG